MSASPTTVSPEDNSLPPSAVPVIVVVDEGYFGQEALVDELGPGFDVAFAEGLVATMSAAASRPLPLVLAPQALAPESGAEVLAGLHERRLDFVGLLLLDDEHDAAGPGVHVLLRRPLRPGQLVAHVRAAAALRARMLTTLGQRDALSNDIGRLRDGLRHDVRGHLQSIIGLTSLLVELERPQRQADDELIDFLTRVLSSAERLDRYIDHVGDWLQAARRPFEVSIVDLGELALEVVAEVRARRKVAPELLFSRPAPPLARVPGDSRLLSMALRHLIDHCLEQTGHAEVEVLPTGHGFVLGVRDLADKTLPPTHRSRAFVLFERAAGGTGVELAVVAKVAERHGGEVTLEPHPEGGHLYRLDLPASIAR
jgi:signal transduction histidine kinase